jgi:DNA-directed RNA polymerase subunit RPC12/RpoP
MLSYFCSKCGGKNLYQFQKPKFCSHCGASFSLASANNVNNIKSNQFEVNINNIKNKNENINIIDDDDDESFEAPIQDYSSMRGLDVNIQKYNQDNAIKLGELVSDEPIKQIAANKKITKQKRGRKKIAKSLPESFVSEAKMSGRNNQNYEQPNIVDNED